MELCGSESPALLDGQSLWPLLSGQGTLEDRPLFFHFPVYLEAYRKGYDGGRDPLFRTRPGSVVREGDWKLHYYYEDGGTELYNLRTDTGERNDLSSVYPLKTEELLTKLEVWLKDEQAPVNFELNPAFDSLFERQLSRDSY
jgi:arylsulfatase A-like enzyme